MPLQGILVLNGAYILACHSTQKIGTLEGCPTQQTKISNIAPARKEKTFKDRQQRTPYQTLLILMVVTKSQKIKIPVLFK
jgi:hypothetical protein